MKYVKATIVIHKDKNTLRKEEKRNIKKIRDYLYSISCFDIDYISAYNAATDYRESNIIIDMSNSQKLRSREGRYNIYVSFNFADFDKQFNLLRMAIAMKMPTIYNTKIDYKNIKLPDLYHISLNPNLPARLIPGGNYKDEQSTSLEDATTENLPPRISFSSSIEGCFRGIYPNIVVNANEANGKELVFFVYKLSKDTKASKFMSPHELTEKQLVHDACFTSEYVLFKSVFVSKIAKIGVKIANDPRENKITYGFFGQPPVGEDTGWAPDMSYRILSKFSTKASIMSKYDLLLKDY